MTYEHYGVTPTGAPSPNISRACEKQGMGINLASYVGATQVRRVVIGDDNRAPTRRANWSA